MAALSANEVHKLAERECHRNLYQQELEDILSWASGAYSVSTIPLEINPQTLYEAMIGERELTASRLSERQKEAAKELKQRHGEMAIHLREQEKKSAQRLIEKNTRKAIELAEKQKLGLMRSKSPAIDDATVQKP